MKITEKLEFLGKADNWNEIMVYIHRTRLIMGFFFGVSTGICIGLLIK